MEPFNEILQRRGFNEEYRKYYTKQAPGHLGHWTEVVVDLRWLPDLIIKGKRGDETDNLFNGIIEEPEELVVLLKQTKVI